MKIHKNTYTKEKKVAYAYNKGDTYKRRGHGDFENWQKYVL